MITYGLIINETEGNCCFESPQFPGIKGIAQNRDMAFISLMSQVENQLQETIQEGKTFPQGIDRNKLPSQKNTGSFMLPLSAQFTLQLHSVMLQKKISRKILARLLALDSNDVKSEEWNLEHTINIAPKNELKYDDVDKLLNIIYPSTINEMAEAFRVLGFDITFSLYEQNKR